MRRFRHAPPPVVSYPREVDPKGNLKPSSKTRVMSGYGYYLVSEDSSKSYYKRMVTKNKV